MVRWKPSNRSCSSVVAIIDEGTSTSRAREYLVVGSIERADQVAVDGREVVGDALQVGHEKRCGSVCYRKPPNNIWCGLHHAKIMQRF